MSAPSRRRAIGAVLAWPLAARALGLAVPINLLIRADEVIE
jgi:hypothetical protein